MTGRLVVVFLIFGFMGFCPLANGLARIICWMAKEEK